MIPGFKDLSYNERLLLLKLPSLKYRRLRGDLIEVYNILNRKESDNVKTICRLSEVKHTRGHNKKLALSHSNTNRKTELSLTGITYQLMLLMLLTQTASKISLTNHSVT